MKQATLPSLRVEPELRQAAESVLAEGETLSAMVVTSVREAIARRRARAEFLSRGLAAREALAQDGESIPAATVQRELERKLAGAKRRIQAAQPKTRR
jgi:hypothetical protein